MVYKIIVVFTIIILPIFLMDCSDDGPDLGKYYQKSFVDSIDAVVKADTVKIIIEQFGVVDLVKENIPIDTINYIFLSDTIKLILNVNFGSYSPNPAPYKELFVSSDTLYLWYASREKPKSTHLYKSSSINNISGIQTSPKLEYYSIENVIIKKSPKKKIYFESKLYK